MSTADSTLKDVIGQQANRGFFAWLISRQVFWIFLATIAAVVFMAFRTDTFFTPGNLFNVTRNFAFVGIIALGMTAVIITGGIDLSVGGTMLIGGIVTAVLMSTPLHWGVVPAFLAAMAACAAVGLVNGLLIAVVGLQPFVVTLGMMVIARSLGLVISNNRLIIEFGPEQKLLTDIGSGAQVIDLSWLDLSFLGSIFPSLAGPLAPLPVPNPLIIMLVLTVIFGFLFRWTRWGRHLFAIGGNEKAAVLTGVPVKTIKISVYVIVALLSGLAGWLQVGWLGSAPTSMGTGMELTVIAAAVIGGANLVGGTGTAFGAIIGAALIEVIRNSLTLLKISTFWQGTFVGVCILLAVAFDKLRNKDTSE